MVLVSDQAKHERFSKVISWLNSQDNNRNWTKESVAFSHKVAYYVPKEYCAKDKSDIDDEKVFELMRFQGWKGKLPKQQLSPPPEEVCDDDKPTDNIQVFDDEEEKNPVVLFDGYMKALRGVLMDNIQYNSKDEEISRLTQQVQQLQKEVTVLKRTIRDMDEDADLAMNCVMRLHKKSCKGSQ